MCGIVGYTGPREAGPILIEGLRRLEYRGYDSAGIALVDEQGDLFVEKRAGKLANLQTALADGTPHAALGLAHTRWATHGRPNDLNAHPHQDCTGEITVIHNGIIENFRELRDELEGRGHVLDSETDTEAIAHLVEEAYQGDLADAVRAALQRLEGAYALVVMHKGEPSRLVGARLNVPLVVGLQRRGELPRVRRRRDPRPHRPGHLPRGGRRRRRPADRRGRSPTSTARRRERAGHDIDWTPEAAEKGGYDHFMLKEMHEQPEALRQSHRRPRHARRRRSSVDELDAARGRDPRAPTRVELVACGTAVYASLVGADAHPGLAGHAGAGRPSAPSSATRRRRSTRTTLVIAVTQSGETADTIAPTRCAREQGCPIIAVTNTVGSAITREADAVLFLQAGPEIAVVATKTFVTQVTTLVVLAAAIAKPRGRLAADRERELVDRAARAARRRRSAPSSSRAGDGAARAALRQLARLHVRRPRLHVSRPRSRARSSSRRSATSTPRATPRASSSTARSRCSTRSAARRGRDPVVGSTRS